MALYEDMVYADIAGPIEKEIRAGQLEIQQDNTIDGDLHTTLDTPWIYSRYPGDRDCVKWSNYYFDKYNLIPRHCYGCWKVAMKLPDFETAYRVSELQAKLGLPGKVGMDRRWYTPMLWSAFWYAPLGGGLKKARKFYSVIAKAVKKEFKGELKPFLKRACTEFELKFGNSDQWQYTEAHRNLEALLDSVYAMDTTAKGTQLSLVRNHVMRQWFMYAHKHGDMTYIKYAERAIASRPVTYQNSIHNPKDLVTPKGLEIESDNSSRDARKIALV